MQCSALFFLTSLSVPCDNGPRVQPGSASHSRHSMMKTVGRAYVFRASVLIPVRRKDQDPSLTSKPDLDAQVKKKNPTGLELDDSKHGAWCATAVHRAWG